MANFAGINFYVPEEGLALEVPPPDQLDYDTTELAHRFHRDLLRNPKGFGGQVILPYHVPIDFLWCPLTETSGFTLWRTNNSIRAASCLLVGVETPEDVNTFSIGLAAHGLRTAAPSFSTMMKGERPLLTTLHYDLRSVGDVVLATVAPVFAAAYFGMFR